ncbi:fructosamine kinase family protein [Marinobacterium lutimaris]|uniref:Fructosamine-3-kinase n=1 Tax=Marinobacterium lutimaris TaxID=568106 RepID=A0A1H5WWF5_9GAMM|nr:fructosamine kinase family protein [Marinobacterium lutimaris]SEG03633.1 Fructosamine-3-kinase [Marinobacterium lutimaris]
MQGFIKTNPLPGSDSLICEAKGLELLETALNRASIVKVRVPARLEITRDRLCLELIHCASASEQQMRLLGESLAQIHTQRHGYYGLASGNFIGLSPQSNIKSENWGRFFLDYRLGFQIRRIADSAVRDRFLAELERCREAVEEFLNATTRGPALVHGDLWGGNVLFDRNGQNVWLIDPAVYYADPDVDLAMTEMFGGFSGAFYAAYDAISPRGDDYPLKRAIYNLYHYLNHYNLFGDAYLTGCEEGLAALNETLYR